MLTFGVTGEAGDRLGRCGTLDKKKERKTNFFYADDEFAAVLQDALRAMGISNAEIFSRTYDEQFEE